jgi:hypothetical protein
MGWKFCCTVASLTKFKAAPPVEVFYPTLTELVTTATPARKLERFNALRSIWSSKPKVCLGFAVLSTSFVIERAQRCWS